MTPKIIIEIRGGTVSAVFSNTDIDFMIVDHDNLNIRDELHESYEDDLCVYEPDMIIGKLSDMYDATDRRSQIIAQYIKENKFDNQ